jgi:hypothetical protein
MKTEYQIIIRSSVNDLSTVVNTSMSQGWRCQGGVSACVIERTPRDGGKERYKAEYLQAMTRNEEVKVE